MKQAFIYFLSSFTVLSMFAEIVYSQSGWVRQYPPSQAQKISFLSVSFTGADTGFIVGGYGTILHTTDGGTDWISQSSGTMNWLRGVTAINGDSATAVGDSGTILHTTNGGAVWSRQSSGTMNNLHAVSFADADTGTVVGDSGTIHRTTNGGSAWTSQSSGTVNNLRGVSFTNSNTGTAVGDSGTILRTTNGGITWTNQSFLAGTEQKSYQFYGVSFTDANTGTAVGYTSTITHFYPSGGPGGIILSTTDGGITWNFQSQLESIIFSECPIFGVSFTDAKTGTVVGLDTMGFAGVIWRNMTGIWDWIHQSVGNNGFYGVCFTDSVTGTVVGDNGAIFHTTTGGVTAVKNTPTQEPKLFALEQNYPNPFNPTTIITYQLPTNTLVTLKVYDELGRLVKTLFNEVQTAGTHSTNFNASSLSSGAYFFTLTAGGFVQTKRLMFVK